MVEQMQKQKQKQKGTDR